MKKYTPFELALIQLGKGATLTRVLYWRSQRAQCLFTNGPQVSAGVFASLERQNWIERSAMPTLNLHHGYTAFEYKISAAGAQHAAALIEQHERFATSNKKNSK